MLELSLPKADLIKMLKTLKKLFTHKKDECVCHTETKTLSDAQTGQHVRIECLRGEEGVCQRLREMGFCEKAVVEKVAQSGALICRVCDAKVSKVILSKELAKKIIVKDICLCEGEEHKHHGRS